MRKIHLVKSDERNFGGFSLEDAKVFKRATEIMYPKAKVKITEYKRK